MGTVKLIAQGPLGARLNFTGPSTRRPYTWFAATDGETIEVDEADVPGLLELTYKTGQDCGCSGHVPVAQGNNIRVNYFRLST